MRPADFWGLTLSEFAAICKRSRVIYRKNLYGAAMICANQINLKLNRGKPPIDPEALLPRIDDDSKAFDAAAVLERLRELKEQDKAQQ